MLKGMASGGGLRRSVVGSQEEQAKHREMGADGVASTQQEVNEGSGFQSAWLNGSRKGGREGKTWSGGWGAEEAPKRV